MKRVLISDLKAHLSEHLRSVQAGEALVVMDRKTPIARIVPYSERSEPLVIRKPKPGAPLIRDLPMPPPIHLDVDLMAILEEERADRDLVDPESLK
jgi:prevent-host-death family protein